MDPIARLQIAAERRGAVSQIARLAGLHHVTVLKIVSGKTTNPGIHTVAAIERALDKLEAERREEAPAMGGTPSDRSNGAIPGQRSAARGGNPSQSDGDCGAGRRAHPPSLPAGRVMDDCLGGGEIAGEVEL